VPGRYYALVGGRRVVGRSWGIRTGVQRIQRAGVLSRGCRKAPGPGGMVAGHKGRREILPGTPAPVVMVAKGPRPRSRLGPRPLRPFRFSGCRSTLFLMLK
jgi:hypothetical protein